MTTVRSLTARFLLATFGTLAIACGGASEQDDGHNCADRDSCGAICIYEGRSYYLGAVFLSKDGCNTCGCDASGVVSCTERACSSCESISADYGALMEQAKTCEPQAPNQCTLRVFEGLGCGCGTFVNPGNWDEAAVAAATANYAAAQCGGNVQCGACNVPVTASCSAQGRCVTNSDPTNGTACRVGDTTYPNGSIGIDDPTSCNSCSCENGTLSCTQKDCPLPCPAGMAAGRSCAQCGPVDNCETVETGCFPTCTGTCKAGACIQGLCINTCG